jgi:hypothetical protein
VSWQDELIGGVLHAAVGPILCPVVFVMSYNRFGSLLESLGFILVITIPFAVVVASSLRAIT